MAAPTIQAIETEYAGCRFRSRLEARWAVFFDHLRMAWRYEPEGFEMRDGARYLPDFYLPDTGMFVEVKGGDVALRQDLGRLLAFVKARRQHLVILGDVPSASESDVPAHSMIVSVQDCTQDVVGVVVTDSWSTWQFIPFWATLGGPTTATRYISGLHPADAVMDAYRAARAARFEFGERG